MDAARIRRLLLGFAAGASTGLLVGAIVASWILGAAAGDAEIDRATLIAVTVAVVCGAGGAVVAARSGGDAPPPPG
jgi:hypothetical protein